MGEMLIRISSHLITLIDPIEIVVYYNMTRPISVQ